MAESSENLLLDTKSLDTFMAQKESPVQRYHQINTTYDDIVKTLLSNWVGEGADAFEIEAKKVKANINDIYDILKLMCDTLTDCRQIFDECDKALGDYNRNPEANK